MPLGEPTEEGKMNSSRFMGSGCDREPRSTELRSFAIPLGVFPTVWSVESASALAEILSIIASVHCSRLSRGDQGTVSYPASLAACCSLSLFRRFMAIIRHDRFSIRS